MENSNKEEIDRKGSEFDDLTIFKLRALSTWIIACGVIFLVLFVVGIYMVGVYSTFGQLAGLFLSLYFVFIVGFILYRRYNRLLKRRENVEEKRP